MDRDDIAFLVILFFVFVVGGMFLWASLTDPWVSTKTIRRLPYAEQLMVDAKMKQIRAPIRIDQLHKIQAKYKAELASHASSVKVSAQHLFVSPQVIQALPRAEKSMVTAEIQHTHLPLTLPELTIIQSVWSHSHLLRKQLEAASTSS